jgi:hypothetical protein
VVASIPIAPSAATETAPAPLSNTQSADHPLQQELTFGGALGGDLDFTFSPDSDMSASTAAMDDDFANFGPLGATAPNIFTNNMGAPVFTTGSGYSAFQPSSQHYGIHQSVEQASTLPTLHNPQPTILLTPHAFLAAAPREPPRSTSALSFAMVDDYLTTPVEDNDFNLVQGSVRSKNVHPSLIDDGKSGPQPIELWVPKWHLFGVRSTLVEKGKDFDGQLQYSWFKALQAWSELAFSHRLISPNTPVSVLCFLDLCKSDRMNSSLSRSPRTKLLCA